MKQSEDMQPLDGLLFILLAWHQPPGRRGTFLGKLTRDKPGGWAKREWLRGKRWEC